MIKKHLKEEVLKMQRIAGIITESEISEEFEPDYSPGEYVSEELQNALFKYLDFMKYSKGQKNKIEADVEYTIGKMIADYIKKNGL